MELGRSLEGTKVFTFEDSTIIWRKNKNLLSFDREKESDVIRVM